MTDSIRQQIIDAIDTRFKTILVLNDYKTDLGDNVFAWRETPLSATEVPGLIYRDRTDERETRHWVYCDKDLILEVDIFSTSVEQIRECLAEVEKAIHTDETWGGLAFSTDLKADEMRVEQKENIFVATNVVASIHYRTLAGDPYH